ncbi:hypothetical protein DM2_1382 [Halorubrum sp. DM2]|uniref:hypothetical protein n=1 Tax=Halorubrum sp. DM2 TaxID=2527867 RepID=UPI0024B7CB1B|nr:hypothetical protein [Halorubrum sp. DM2]VTT88048.1 hypothetical protein DM2_1382 [Halorubrum sp. DM2]
MDYRRLSRFARTASDAGRAGLSELGTRLRVRTRHAALRARYGPGAPEPYATVSVDPAAVEYLLTPRFYDEWLGRRGTYVVGGDWDRRYRSPSSTYPSTTALGFEAPTLARFENYTLFRSIRAHFTEGTPWRETDIYRYRAGRPRYGTGAEVLEDLRATDDLYEAVERDGYRRQSALGEDGPGDAPPAFDEVRVDIGRDGAVIFDDGRHRLSVAKLLDLPQIPVRVVARHPRWQRLRTEVARAADPSALSDAARRHLDHPDLAEFRPL